MRAGMGWPANAEESRMSLKKIGLIAAGAVTVGGLALAGSTIASAATPAPAPSGSAGAGGNHTAATADETAKVTAALTAKDPAVSVTSVRKDADGSYDVFATKAGSQVMFDVSADLKTITEGRAGHGGGRGGSNHTAATADETAKVTAALTAKDPAVTVTSVRKDADGSYDVFATKAGSQVMFDVSADLKTISQDAGQARHGGHPGPSASSTTN
ncbi:MAG: type transport system permease protein [Micromonosporaceae bacterium]|nr:type transport system permease protein [Micromonosporaceae bacterium]